MYCDILLTSVHFVGCIDIVKVLYMYTVTLTLVNFLLTCRPNSLIRIMFSKPWYITSIIIIIAKTATAINFCKNLAGCYIVFIVMCCVLCCTTNIIFSSITFKYKL